jgi:oligopeptide/dipeptide ABC transporter ATP-binding protein
MPINLTLGELQTEFILGLIIFLFGIYFIQGYAKEKRWDESRSTAFKVSLLWLIIDIPLRFFFLYFFGNSILFIPLRIALKIIISSSVVETYYKKEYLESLAFAIIIHIIFIIFELITISFTSVLLFLVGLLYIKWHINLKRWDNPFFSSLLINTTWFVVGLTIYSLIGQNLFTYLLIVFINTIVGFVILGRIYKNEWFGSLEIVGLAQISLFITSIFINFLFDIVDIFLVEGDDKLTGARFVFFIMFLATFGMLLFISNWGDKLQLVKLRNVVVIVSVIPGLLYIIAAFLSQQVSFFDNFLLTFIIILIISIITIVGARRIAYTTIPIQELREHHILEKDKSLLKVTDLKVYYPLLKGMLKRKVGDIKAVDGVTFEIKTGETLGLVGESGCGKTTIANTILGLIEKEDGEILYHEDSVPTELTSYLRQKIQMVFQDPDASLNPRLKVTNIIAEPLKNLLGITNKMKIRRHVLRLLKQVSLKREHMDRYPHEFSGGQKQRIIIARALACNPELIVLDEPTSALDVSVQAQILNLLIDLQEEYGYGFLFITHNLAVVNHIADRVAVMYLGKFVEIGETDQIFSNPTHPYTQALLKSHTEIDPFDQDIKYVIDGEVPSPIAPPPGCTFNPRCVSDARTPECEIDLPHKIKIEEGHYIWCVNPPIGVEDIEETDLFTGKIEEEAYRNP